MDNQTYNGNTKDVIYSRNLSNVIDRLVKIEGWTRKQASQACQQYRNFIFLIKKFGSTHIIPPSKDIDEFWHAHILHTNDYADFCYAVFGKFLHHAPGHGSNGNNINSIEKYFEENTQNLYFNEFGEYLYDVRSNFLKSMLNNLKNIIKPQGLSKLVGST